MPMTALPTPPSRQDPTNFAERADTLMAALPGFVTEANALQADVGAKQTTASSAASTASAKASEAAAARDIAMAAVNYHGLWSSLSGALAIPASVYHSGSVWLLKESVANVATETPGVSTKWLNVTPASGLGTAAYADETDFQPAIGVLAGLLLGNGVGGISVATAANIVSAIGALAVANATHAATADSATSADSVIDGAISSALKIANSILTGSKFAPNTIPFDKLVRTGTAGKPLVSGGAGADFFVGDFPPSAVVSVGGNAGTVTDAQLRASVASQALTAGTSFVVDGFAGGSQSAASWLEVSNGLILIGGTLRISFRLAAINASSGGTGGYGRIYKNGVAFGTTRSVTYNGDTVFTEDLAFSVGDTFQIFVQGNAPVNGCSGVISEVAVMTATKPFMTFATKIPVGVR